MNQCPMYPTKYPAEGDCVTVRIRSIGDTGAHVELLEYGKIEGLILLSEVSRKNRIRSLAHLMRVGKQEVVKVLRVDQDKGFIDLSKRLIHSDEIKAQEQKFAKSKQVHQVVQDVCVSQGCSMLEVYETLVWDLYRRFPHAEDGLRQCLGDPSILHPYNLTTPFEEGLLQSIRRRFDLPTLRIRAEIEVSCFTYEGIDAIKASLGKGNDCATPDMPIKVQLLAPPRYLVHATTRLAAPIAIDLMKHACEQIGLDMQSRGGFYRLIQAPFVVTRQADEELQKRLEWFQKEVKEISDDETTG